MTLRLVKPEQPSPDDLLADLATSVERFAVLDAIDEALERRKMWPTTVRVLTELRETIKKGEHNERA